MIQLSSSKRGSALIMHVTGRIDAVTAPEFEQACLEAVQPDDKLLVLDFGEAQYISSAGLRSLLVMGKRMQERGGVLRLANVTGVVGQVFELSGIYSIFPRFSSVEEAAS